MGVDFQLSHRMFRVIRIKKSTLKQYSALLPASLLAACGGGSGSQTPPPVVTPPAPSEPDFSESPANTFTAKDNSNGLTLSEGSNTNDLTVIGKDGNDNITTGSGNDDITAAGGNDTISSGAGNDLLRGGDGNDSISAGDGNDLIWAGAGADTINAGAGDDVIVLIGTTTAGAYTDAAITSPAGQSFSLESLISLSDVNGNGTSDVTSGETIDGGIGSNTLVIYGDVDLTGVTLTNVDTVWVNSRLTLTLAQLQQFATITGDGSSVLVVTSDGSEARLDLTTLTLSAIDQMVIDSDVTFVLTDINQLAGITSFSVTGSVTIEIGGGTVQLSSLSDLGFTVTSLTVLEGATLDLSGLTLEELRQLEAFSGAGTIILNDSLLGSGDLLSGMFFDSELTVQSASGSTIDVEDQNAISAIRLTLGDATTGTITGSDGVEYYAIYLEAGQVYQIDMKGNASGVGTLIDPLIYALYDSNGDPIANAWDDDGAGGSRESSFLFQPTESGYYFIEAASWGGEQGSYQISVENVTDDFDTSGLPIGPTNRNSVTNVDYSVEATGDLYLDGLLYGTKYEKDPDGTTTTITWSFGTADNYSNREGFAYDDPTGTDTGAEPYVGFEELTPEQQALFKDIIAYVGAVFNITFVQVADEAGPEGSPGSAGNIRIAWTGLESDAGAWAYLPNGGPTDGDIWLMSQNISQNVNDPYLAHVMIHELGHALGLSHSFDDDGFGTVPIAYDSMDYTVMSYTESREFATAVYADIYPQTFMILDIRALGYLYGFRAYNEDDTTYTFDMSEDYYMTLWDTGGEDTIVFTNANAGVHLDLSGDQWSDVGTSVRFYGSTGIVVGRKESTVYIPEEADIENASGTSYGDTIIGGLEDNKLSGLGGDDVINGGGGADMIGGGAGRDQLTGGSGDDIFIIAAGEGAATAAEADVVFDFTDGEDKIGLVNLTFDDLTIVDSQEDVLIQDSEGNILLVLDNVDHSLIDANDFVTVSSDWF